MSVVIETGFTGIVEPIDHPRICYDSPAATATASSAAEGYDPNWVTDGETWSVWHSNGGGASLTISFTAGAQTCSYAGLAAHNLGTIGATVTCTVGGVTVGSVSPDNDDAILFLFDAVSASSVQFSISASDTVKIAVAQAGEALELPRLSVFTGLPISQSRQVTYREQRSITGNVLGRSLEGAMLQFDLTINNLPETFRAATGSVSWDKFLRHVDEVGPFFVAAKPLKYPDDVAYARVSERPRFERQTPNFRLSGSITLSCTGYSAP